MPDHGEHVAALFEAAVSLDPGQRSAFLDRACGDKGSPRQEVEELLDADAAAGSFLKHPVFDLPTADDSHASQATIGPYTLLELIGQGGMGEVWLAEQRQPVRRRVAIKLIKVGMDTKEVVARFESERQALALMDHPAIAKVFDAGSTPEGRPYFVMEYVPGLPITGYCDKHKLTIRQRLELFIRVCDGVQHAHQKAIIHRDLKPSNILVSEVDGKPVPRVIDFGVSKAISQTLTARTVYTRIGTLIGTVGYMSPEQADSGGENIDTRTDVYSLGAVLFELLAGTLPLDLDKLPYDEVLRRLREQDVPRPSTRLSALGDKSSIAAKNRGADLSSLSRLLRGDPDVIALKALEKDRARRYASASGLAADIERYLRNEPVTAHPPSTTYRARKYIRRHRLGVTMATAGVLLLATFAVVQSIQLRRIRRERDRADRITQFMTGMFKISDPSEARGNTVTAREILDKASREIDTGLAHDPTLQAQMMSTMAGTYYGLGLYRQAESLDERALAIRQRLFGPRDRETLRLKSDLAEGLLFEGRYAEADRVLRETLKAQREVVGSEDPDSLLSMDRLGSILDMEAKYPEALALMQSALDVERRTLGPEDSQTIGTRYSLGDILRNMGRYPDAETVYRELLDAQRRTLGPEHPDTLLAMHGLAIILRTEGKYAEAEKIFREVLDKRRRLLGPEHPETAETMTQLAHDLQSQGRYPEAEKLAREALGIEQRVNGPESLDATIAQDELALVFEEEGHYEDAEKLYREAIRTATKTNAVSLLASSWYGLACMSARAGRHDKAFEYLGHAIDNGYAVPEWMTSDPDLKPLHGDPRFDALVAKARQTAAR
jgi:eukaryotic-like serine/threonine-protein kinase